MYGKEDIQLISEIYIQNKRETHNKHNKNKLCVQCGCHLEESYVKEYASVLTEASQTDCNGVVIYRGSKYVCVATGLMSPSKNEKTGPMVQVYIIPSEVLPSTAIKTGQDAIVCFNCKHRGTTCYVNVGQGVDMVYRTFEKGSYPDLPSENGVPTNTELWKGLFEGSSIRFGAYGEPVRIPLQIVSFLTEICGGRITGYTHQWERFPEYKKFFMASVDTPDEYVKAKGLGWRTFRVSPTWEEKDTNETFCKFNLDGTQCIDCLKCRGTMENDKDIFVKVHGMKYKTNSFVENMAESDFEFPPMTDEERKIAKEIEAKEQEKKKSKKEDKTLSPLEKLLQAKKTQQQQIKPTSTIDYMKDAG
jgi:hypothetical protein